jgi:hypothetical protein
MSAAATMPQKSLSRDLWPRTIQELRAFVGVAEKQEVDVSVTVADLFKRVAQVSDNLICSVLEKRTAEEFMSATALVMNDYVRLLRAKSDILQIVLRGDSRTTERLVHQSLTELEAEFRDNGKQKFGAEVAEQALFTIWTLRETAELVWQLLEPNVLDSIPNEAKPELGKLNSEFASYSAWAQFTVDCLVGSIRMGKPIYPDALPAVMDGLRAEVNAYALAKQIVDLYLPPVEETDLQPYVWDQEDEELVSSSMLDLKSEENGY